LHAVEDFDLQVIACGNDGERIDAFRDHIGGLSDIRFLHLHRGVSDQVVSIRMIAGKQGIYGLRTEAGTEFPPTRVILSLIPK
jgi:hypothetical protein